MPAVVQNTRSRDIPLNSKGVSLYEKYIVLLEKCTSYQPAKSSVTKGAPLAEVKVEPDVPPKLENIKQAHVAQATPVSPMPELPGSSELKKLAQKRDELKSKHSAQKQDAENKQPEKKIVSQAELDKLPTLDESSKVKSVEAEVKTALQNPKPDDKSSDLLIANKEEYSSESKASVQTQTPSKKMAKETKMLVQGGASSVANTKIKDESKVKSILVFILILLILAALFALGFLGKETATVDNTRYQYAVLSNLEGGVPISKCSASLK